MTVDMGNFDIFSGDLEEYVSQQGATLGENAEMLQKLLDSITYCYVHGVISDSEKAKIYHRYIKLLSKYLYKKEE